MNAIVPHRAILRQHVATVEGRHPIKITGLLPRGAAAHVFDPGALYFLAEKRPGLSLIGLGRAESDLAELLGRPVGIVLLSGLRDRELEEFPRLAERL